MQLSLDQVYALFLCGFLTGLLLVVFGVCLHSEFRHWQQRRLDQKILGTFLKQIRRP
jgi:hypothetical protein